MMNKRQVEIFTADCPLCDETVNTVIGQAGETPASLTVKMVRELACSSCQVSVYDLREKTDLAKAEQYGVNGVPAIAVNGRLVLTGKPNTEQLQAVGIGQPL